MPKFLSELVLPASSPTAPAAAVGSSPGKARGTHPPFPNHKEVWEVPRNAAIISSIKILTDL